MIKKNLSLAVMLTTVVCMNSCSLLFGEDDNPVTLEPVSEPVPTEVIPYYAKTTPLTFEGIAGPVSVTITSNIDSEITIESSLDHGKTWVAQTLQKDTKPSVTITEREVLLRGKNNSYCSGDGKNVNISCDTDCYVYGNVMSLIDASAFATLTAFDTANGKYAFRGLFSGNTHIQNHPDKELLLPATILSENCYEGMFSGCTGLTKAPELPATEIAPRCYAWMFAGCTSLTKAPDLQANYMPNRCYEAMFDGCINLNYIRCLATQSNNIGGYFSVELEAWLMDVAPLGTFVIDSSLDPKDPKPWPKDEDFWVGCGIPLGWTIMRDGDETSAVKTINPWSTPLTLEAISGTMTVQISSDFTEGKPIEYSTDDGVTWVSAIVSSASELSFSCSKVQLRGNNATYGYYDGIIDKSTNINCTKDCYIYGNVMSLINANDFKDLTAFDTSNGKYAFHRLFWFNTHLKNHPDYKLVLPAKTLSEGCYNEMFAGCSGITKAPELPSYAMEDRCYFGMFRSTGLITTPDLYAYKLADECYTMMFSHCKSLKEVLYLSKDVSSMTFGCYSFMFSNCTSLTTPPELPSTKLAIMCYSHMFEGCTSLTQAPELPATILKEYCYNNMFEGCTSLKAITCKAINISADNCLTDWLKNVNATGDFYKDALTTFPIGDSGIPATWTSHDL